MKRLVVAVAAAGATLSGWPASASPPGDSISGGCYFHGSAAVGEGVIGDSSYTTGPNGLPTGAVVTCYITVNGVERPGTRFDYSGFGAQSGANQVTWTPAVGTAKLCQEVLYADASVEPPSCTPINDIGLTVCISCIIGTEHPATYAADQRAMS